MTRRSRIAAVVVTGAAVAVWAVCGLPRVGTSGERASTLSHPAATPDLPAAIRMVQWLRLRPGGPRAVRITGAVIDRLSRAAGRAKAL